MNNGAKVHANEQLISTPTLNANFDPTLPPNPFFLVCVPALILPDSGVNKHINHVWCVSQINAQSATCTEGLRVNLTPGKTAVFSAYGAFSTGVGPQACTCGIC